MPLTVIGTLDGAARAMPIEVALAVIDGTATDPEDYTAGTATLTIEAGQTTGEATIQITPKNDTIVEGDETVTVTGSAGVVEVTDTDVTIEDNDTATWTLTRVPARIGEVGGVSTLTVSPGNVTYAEDQTLSLTLTGTATAGTDYTIRVGDTELEAPYELTLPAGAGSVEAVVAAVDDTADESDETVIIAVAHGGVSIGETATITIAKGICGRTGPVRKAIIAAVSA